MWVLLSVWLICHIISDAYEIRMPDVRTQKDDEYLCYSKPLNDVYYITAFEPIYNPKVTHHMILFGCDDPVGKDGVWSCGHEHPICNDGEKIMFSWAMNAPPYHMPPDTSLKIGDVGFTHLVLQVHYKDASYFTESAKRTDASGWKLPHQMNPTSFLSGMYILADSLSILPPKKTSVASVACQYTGDVSLHPFAFRVHAHGHGLMNTGYLVHNGERYLIGAKSPQDPQTFYPVENPSLEIQPGDILDAKCLFNNTEDREIHMGHTRKDEMCNFYVMYSVPFEYAYQLSDPENQQCATPATDFSSSSMPHHHVSGGYDEDEEDEDEYPDRGVPLDEKEFSY